MLKLWQTDLVPNPAQGGLFRNGLPLAQEKVLSAGDSTFP